MGAGAIGVTAVPAGATGPGAFFALGSLTVTGDGQNNALVISRDAAGKILVNNGTIPIRGGRATVANTRTINVVGGAGTDVITLDEANGALPRANLLGGTGNDTITGGSGGDTLVGQAGNDVMFGKGGFDVMFGGTGNDALSGGDADDQAFGDAGDDRMIWNPGDDTDLNEGGADVDTVEVIGGNGDEQFTTTANGARVRFDRINPAPFAIDIGTSENLVVNANGGNDSFSATGNLATLIKITVDGGAGNDTILGSNGIDTILGGDGNDFVDGQQGNDIGLLGAGDDVFQWDPGDGSDVVEGQDGVDNMLFNGSNTAENFDAAANGGRVRFFRNVGNITMDLDDVEKIALNALGGADNLVVNDLSGTDLTEIVTDLAATPGSGTGDSQPDTVIVNGSVGDDITVVAGQGSDLEVVGFATSISVAGAEPALDRITISALSGDDVVDASGVAAGSMVLSIDGGAGNDVLIDGEAVTDGLVAGAEWLAEHTRLVGEQTVLEVNDTTYTVPEADLVA